MHLATVTEFHEGGRTLTRVALGQHYPAWKNPLIATLCALNVVAAHSSMALHHFSVLWWLSLLGLLWVGWHFRCSSSLHKAARALISATALQCGLLDRSDSANEEMEVTPDELHERALASTGQSAELWPEKP